MAVEHTSAGRHAAAKSHPWLDRAVTFLTDRPTLSLRKGGRALARGQLGAWAFYTDGLIVNGTNPDAITRLLQAKQVDPERIANGTRSLVSVLPDKQHRAGLIDYDKHGPLISAALQGEDDALVTSDGHPIFYRVFAGNAPYLQPPLVEIDPTTGAKTMVLLWHGNRKLQRLENAMRRSAPGEAMLLTGSSANVTGEKQPSLLHDLDQRVQTVVDFTVNARDQRIYEIPLSERGAIPMIDLTTPYPTIRRKGMYPAIPNHQGLQELLQTTQTPIPKPPIAA